MIDDPKLIEKGRKLLWVVIVATAIISILDIATLVAQGRSIFGILIKAGISIGMLYLLYQGYGWVRWVFVVCYGLIGGWLVYGGLAAGLDAGLPNVILGTVLLLVSLSLALSKSIKEFQAFQRQKAQHQETENQEAKSKETE